MIKTIKSTNGSFSKLGNLQVQPVSKLARKVNDVVKKVSLSTDQEPVEIRTLTHSETELKVNQHDSLQKIVTSLTSDKNFLLTPFETSKNNILPSFSNNLEPHNVQNRLIDLTSNIKKFEPYEELTGISRERPEIIMLTDFQPLFNNDVSQVYPSNIRHVENANVSLNMTDVGKLADLHVMSTQLQRANSVQVVKNLRINFENVKRVLVDQHSAFEKSVDSLRDTANFLLGLVRNLDRLKLNLDLRDSIHVVDPRAIVQNHVQFTKINTTTTSNVLSDIVGNYLPTSYSVSELLARFGFNEENIKSRFSSTKIWVQLLLEMNDLFRYHSLELIDAESSVNRTDNNASKLTKSNNAHFSIRKTLTDLPQSSDLSTIKPQQITATINKLNQTWRVLYLDAKFKSFESRIAALTNFLTKEYRYSYGLSFQATQKTLSEQYNYTVQSNNAQVFDAVLGATVNNISEYPALQTNSLINISHRKPGTNTSVLTFETKYLDADTGTLVPGAVFYVDAALKTDGKNFDTSRIDELSDIFESSYKSFNVIVNDLNVLATPVYEPTDKTKTQYSSILSSPVNFIKDVIKHLVNERTGETLKSMIDDNLGSVYSYANTNENVKSLLFLLTLAKITRQYNHVVPFFHVGTEVPDNTPLCDSLVEKIILALETNVPATTVNTSNQATVDQFFQIDKKFVTITRDSIRTALKSGTALTIFVEQIMKQVMTAFFENDRALVNKQTRFNGHLDTTMLMIAFDIIVQMISKLNNQSLVSVTRGHTIQTNGVLTFNVSKTSINHRASMNEIVTRLEKEVALTHGCVYAILNTLQKLSNSFKNHSNYLKSRPAVSKLQEITEIVGDTTLVNLLMNEQQIMMLSSAIYDLVERLTQQAPSDRDDDYDDDHEFKTLDDSVVLPKLKTLLYGFFGTPEYASLRGYNKKILSVGIPLGFVSKIKQHVNLRNQKTSTLVNNKQSDVINVVVYKVDLQNSDIIYKPKKILFELSRFVVRNDKHFLDTPEQPTVNDILRAIPTRDFGEDASFSPDPTYWVSGIDDLAAGLKTSFSSDSYSFLSDSEKRSIINNHVTSYMLELYVKLISGISLADYQFDVIEPSIHVNSDIVKLLTENHISNTMNVFAVEKKSSDEQRPTGGVLFSSTTKRRLNTINQRLSNTTGTPGVVSNTSQFSNVQARSQVKTPDEQRASTKNSVAGLATISKQNVPVVLHGLRTISNLAHTLTPLSDTASTSKKLISPKQFDRVFNITVDPDEFEIDYDKTVATPQGKLALEQMIKRGDIIPTTELYLSRNLIDKLTGDLQTNPVGRAFSQNRGSTDHSLFRYRDRDKKHGDLAFEKYFTTVETYTGENK